MTSVQESQTTAFDFLCQCCGSWVGGDSVAVEDAELLDWGQISRSAFSHGLQPLLFHLFKTDRLLPSPPAQDLDRWEAAYYDNYVFNTAGLDLLTSLDRELFVEGVPVLALKGPVSILRHYRDPGLRTMADLDLFCQRSDLDSVVGAATRHGFEDAEQNAAYHLALKHPASRTLLELHFDLYDLVLDRHAFADRSFAAAKRTTLEQWSFFAPSLEHHLVIELAHLVNHDYRVGLKSLLDFALGMASEDLDQQKLHKELSATDLQPEYQLTCSLIDHLFGSDEQRKWVHGEDAILAALRSGTDGRAMALEELSIRPGIVPKLAYLCRLLIPKQRTSQRKIHPSLAHIESTFRRGWSKFRAFGLADSTASGSVKRNLYQRRRASQDHGDN